MIHFEEILKHDAEVMRLWKGKDCKDDFDEIKCGRPCKLPLLEQFFMMLVWLHLELLELDLANRFQIGVFQSTVSRITLMWIYLLYRGIASTSK